MIIIYNKYIFELIVYILRFYVSVADKKVTLYFNICKSSTYKMVIITHIFKGQLTTQLTYTNNNVSKGTP